MKKFITIVIAVIATVLSFNAGAQTMSSSDSLKIMLETCSNCLGNQVEPLIKESVDSMKKVYHDSLTVLFRNKQSKYLNSKIVVDGGSLLSFEKDSQGLISPRIIFKNLSNKTVKYYTIRVSYINSVGDPCHDEFGRTLTSLKGVGPIAPNGVAKGYWDTIYDSWCATVKLKSIYVLYTDGTSATFYAKDFEPIENPKFVEYQKISHRLTELSLMSLVDAPDMKNCFMIQKSMRTKLNFKNLSFYKAGIMGDIEKAEKLANKYGINISYDFSVSLF